MADDQTSDTGVVARLVDAVNRGSVGETISLVSPRYQDHDPVGGLGNALFRRLAEDNLGRCDLHITAEHLSQAGECVTARLFVEGYVRLRMTAPGTGHGQAIPFHMTGRTVSIFRVHGGRVLERWGPVGLRWSAPRLDWVRG